jgi:hypothetical protein
MQYPNNRPTVRRRIDRRHIAHWREPPRCLDPRAEAADYRNLYCWRSPNWQRVIAAYRLVLIAVAARKGERQKHCGNNELADPVHG